LLQRLRGKKDKKRQKNFLFLFFGFSFLEFFSFFVEKQDIVSFFSFLKEGVCMFFSFPLIIILF